MSHGDTDSYGYVYIHELKAIRIDDLLLTIPLELFIPFMLIFVTNLTVGAVSGYLGPHSTFRLYILFS